MRKILLSLLIFTAVSAAAGVRTDLQEGGELYQEGKYGQALSKYVQAVEKEPGNEKAIFNAGNAYYQLKDYGNAEKAFTDVSEKGGTLQEDALFNLGNAYYRAGNKEKAAKSYEKAILMQPKDKEAVHNLQLILQEQQNQNNQNQNQNNQSSDSKNQDQQDKQDGKGQSPQDQEQEQQPSQSQEDMKKEDASRVMQMAKENEHKKPTSSGQTPAGTNVEKDW